MMKDNQLTMGVEETIAADGENWSQSKRRREFRKQIHTRMELKTKI